MLTRLQHFCAREQGVRYVSRAANRAVTLTDAADSAPAHTAGVHTTSFSLRRHTQTMVPSSRVSPGRVYFKPATATAGLVADTEFDGPRLVVP